jgi:hypothetical protein
LWHAQPRFPRIGAVSTLSRCRLVRSAPARHTSRAKLPSVPPATQTGARAQRKARALTRTHARRLLRMRGRTPTLTRPHGRLTVPLSDSAPLSAAKQTNRTHKQTNKHTNKQTSPRGGGRLTPLPLEAALAMALVSPYPREIEDLYKLEACVLPCRLPALTAGPRPRARVGSGRASLAHAGLLAAGRRLAGLGGGREGWREGWRKG